MTTRAWRAAVLVTLLTLSRTAVAAEGDTTPPTAAASVEGAGTAEGDGGESSDTDGGDVVGIALMVIGGGAAAVGATMLVIDASAEEETRDETGLDPGLEGVRGRSGQEAADDGDVVPTIGTGLLIGGAVVHLIGVVIAFGSHDHDHDDDAPPPAARVEPLVGPGFGGLRGTF